MTIRTTTSAATRVLAVAEPRERARNITMSSSGPSDGWIGKVDCRLQELIRLEEGWDGYKAFPVSFQNACFARYILDAIYFPELQVPSIVPGVAGDLQLEWHFGGGKDVELWIHRPNKVSAWFDYGDDSEELELTVDFKCVVRAIKQMMETNVAAVTSAA